MKKSPAVKLEKHNGVVVPVGKTQSLEELAQTSIETNALSDYDGPALRTAGSAHIGRGTMLQLFHGSESAYWPNTDALMSGVLQGVADLPETEIIFASSKSKSKSMPRPALSTENPRRQNPRRKKRRPPRSTRTKMTKECCHKHEKIAGSKT
jgi:hypothetical protein